jgi:hypothetical protein
LPKRRTSNRQNAERFLAKTPNEFLPKRRTNFCQNAERFPAKTPNEFLPKRRTIFRQNAEKLLQMRQTKDIMYLSELYLRGGLYEGI